MDREARAAAGHEHRRLQDHAPARVLQHAVRPVLDRGARTQGREVGVHAIGDTEEQERLVDQVRSEVEPDAAPGHRGFPPAVPDGRAEAVDPGLEVDDVPEPAGADQLGDAQEVAVEAAVLEHPQHPPGLDREVAKLPRLGETQRQGLVYHHVPTRPQGRARERRVLVVRGGDHHEVHVVASQELVHVRHHDDVRQVRVHRVRAARDDMGESESLRGVEQGDVERLPGEPVADQRGADRCVGGGHAGPPGLAAGMGASPAR